MRRTTMLWEVFVKRFEDAFWQYRRGRLNAEEAGELLGISGRHFRRLRDRYEEEGEEGLRDRRIGKVSPRRAPERELARMQELYRERYSDFTAKHFHEQLQDKHHYKLGYTVTGAASLVVGPDNRTSFMSKRPKKPAMLASLQKLARFAFPCRGRRSASCRSNRYLVPSIRFRLKASTG